MEYQRPAILGGRPIRPEGPLDWPGRNPLVELAVTAALADGSWGKYHGPHVEMLTDHLANFHNVEHVALCSSGTVAVELALRGVGVGPGDEVILAAYDFKGNFQDVLALGATPVLIDVRPDNWCLDETPLEAAVSNKSKAIIASHLHGGVVNLPIVRRIADEHGLALVEDAAQMPGATIHAKIAGTWGDVGVFSFGGSKLVTAGRGGAVVTNREDVAQRIRIFTQRGNDAYPLSELQAAALLPQWKTLFAANSRRSQAVARLNEYLAHLSGLRLFRNASSDSQPGYYKVGIQYNSGAFAGMSRDLFAAAVRAEGIPLDPGFRALHKTHSGRRFRSVGELLNASQADASVLTLHHPLLLGEDAELRQAAAAIEKVARFADEIAAAAASRC